MCPSSSSAARAGYDFRSASYSRVIERVTDQLDPVISNLLAGHLLLLRQDDPAGSAQPDDRQVELIRRRFELVFLSLPQASSRTSCAEGPRNRRPMGLRSRSHHWSALNRPGRSLE
jgi:hypothetical protein